MLLYEIGQIMIDDNINTRNHIGHRPTIIFVISDTVH